MKRPRMKGVQFQNWTRIFRLVDDSDPPAKLRRPPLNRAGYHFIKGR